MTVFALMYYCGKDRMLVLNIAVVVDLLSAYFKYDMKCLQ